ncbi:unnamed protein product [Staurois parvus]|uniref:Uncharacterized protein n=1 Tax=Staurois parvus TaxID=386267 RepID=A0ABN9FS66_9NEOB|nr:unnamed protein product [Staurois parvus]
MTAETFLLSLQRAPLLYLTLKSIETATLYLFVSIPDIDVFIQIHIDTMLQPLYFLMSNIIAQLSADQK